MASTAPDQTYLCPPQGDSLLSIVASWVGIVTFITTSLGGFTIFYTMYKSLKTAQEAMILYATAIVKYGEEVSRDTDALDKVLSSSTGNRFSTADVATIIQRSREVSDGVGIELRHLNEMKQGPLKTLEMYKLSQSSRLKHAMEDLKWMTRSLEAGKINLLLERVQHLTSIIESPPPDQS